MSQQSFQNKKSKKSYRRGHSDQPTSQDNIFKKLDQRSLCASITQLGSCQGNGEPQAKTAATAPRWATSTKQLGWLQRRHTRENPGRWPGCAGALTGPWDRAPDRSQETLTQALNPKDHILHKPRHRPTGSSRHRTAHALTGMDVPQSIHSPCLQPEAHGKTLWGNKQSWASKSFSKSSHTVSYTTTITLALLDRS